MSIFNTGPQPSVRGRLQRILSTLAHHHAAFKEAFEWSDWAAAALTFGLLISYWKRWVFPEWLRLTSEAVHIIGFVLLFCYVVLRILFQVARRYVLPPDPFDSVDEHLINWQNSCSPDVSLVLAPGKSSLDYAHDLEAAVRLCHDSLGFEHDTFTSEKRWNLYDGWCKSNEKSIQLIKPTFGSARNQAIGVTIILPLTPDGLPFIQEKKGGVLNLDARHIYPSSRRRVPILLIDTLLLKDEWIPAYGPLALQCLFHHASLFYHPQSWINTELYCCMHQGGAVGTYLPSMRRLLDKRGFTEFGKTAEGETIFRLCLKSLNSDPQTTRTYQRYKMNLEKCASLR